MERLGRHGIPFVSGFDLSPLNGVIVRPVSDVLARVRSLNREELRDTKALLQLCADARCCQRSHRPSPDNSMTLPQSCRRPDSQTLPSIAIHQTRSVSFEIKVCSMLRSLTETVILLVGALICNVLS